MQRPEVQSGYAFHTLQTDILTIFTLHFGQTGGRTDPKNSGRQVWIRGFGRSVVVVSFPHFGHFQ
jgi:hypothetical protein